jgi:hypothetical protein
VSVCDKQQTKDIGNLRPIVYNLGMFSINKAEMRWLSDLDALRAANVDPREIILRAKKNSFDTLPPGLGVILPILIMEAGTPAEEFESYFKAVSQVLLECFAKFAPWDFQLATVDMGRISTSTPHYVIAGLASESFTADAVVMQQYFINPARNMMLQAGVLPLIPDLIPLQEDTTALVNAVASPAIHQAS